jgi:hypothetical protein
MIHQSFPARRLTLVAALGATIVGISRAPAPRTAAQADYRWSRVTEAAAFDGAYNFPVFVVRNEMWAFHPRGYWSSHDGSVWVRSALPLSGLNSGYQKYVLFHDAVYALGTMQGNYLDLHLTSRIARTEDLKEWQVVAQQSDLPLRVFYGAVVYQDRIWLIGGFDGRNYYNDVWNSIDGVRWTRVTEHAAWSARNVDMAAVFQGKLWIIGGGLIDGQTEINPNAKREVWSSTDGVHWVESPVRAGSAWGGAPIVFNDQLWLIAANRNSTFAPATLATADGAVWREETAPWPPRGAPAVWVFGNRLFMAGGKYSVMENGVPRFIYRNDVWSLTRAQPPGGP